MRKEIRSKKLFKSLLNNGFLNKMNNDAYLDFVNYLSYHNVFGLDIDETANRIQAKSSKSDIELITSIINSSIEDTYG